MWKSWKTWKKWIFQISTEKKHENKKEQMWFSPSTDWKIWKCGNNGKKCFFRFQLKRKKKEILKNKHGLVYSLLGNYGNVEIMEKMEKVDFSYFY